MRQPSEYEAIRATRHAIVLNGQEVQRSMPELRAEKEEYHLGTLPTDQGDVEILEVEFGPLTKDSQEKLHRLREQQHTFGKKVIAVGSFFAAYGAKWTPGLELDPMQTSISVGYPAVINRENRRVKEARRIGVLPVRPTTLYDRRDYFREVEAARAQLLRQQEEPLRFISRSPDALPLPDLGLESLEPDYRSQEIGHASPGNVQIAREWPGSVAERPPLDPTYLTALHSKALIAMLLLKQQPPEVAARLVMPLESGRDKEGQVIPGIQRVGVLGPKTLELLSKTY